tara:strand:- start:114 stop:557 length:444 start_codon:yes stop_codon:yes gene_type:complete
MHNDVEMVEDCVFCKIIRGEIPSVKLYEDQQTYSFMDINPISFGHSLVIPKHHAENIYVTPPHASGAAMIALSKVSAAINRAIEPEGINILQANGPGAKQSVFHTHFHIIPRSVDDGLTMNWELQPGDMAEIKLAAKKIRAELEMKG